MREAPSPQAVPVVVAAQGAASGIWQRLSTQRVRRAINGYLFISPWLVGFLIFQFFPILASIYFSFTDYTMVRFPPNWVGFDNYVRLFTADPDIPIALRVTAVYSFITVPLHLAISMSLAMLLNTNIKGVSGWRTLYYLPSLIGGVAVSMLWLWIFTPHQGILDRILRVFGISSPGWLGSRTWALPSLIIMSLWGAGGNIILYLAGLQSIPTELYEAGKIDGTTRLSEFWRITIPLMTPVLFFTLVMGVIGSFQVFTQAYIMTDGGPAKTTMFYVLLLYRHSFQWFQMGYGAAMSWLLFVIILILTLLVFKSSPAWVHYSAMREQRKV